jgi:hypothetical protein
MVTKLIYKASYDTIQLSPMNSTFAFAPTDSRKWYFLVSGNANESAGIFTINPVATSYVNPNQLITVTTTDTFAVYKLGNNPGNTGLIQTQSTGPLQGILTFFFKN